MVWTPRTLSTSHPPAEWPPSSNPDSAPRRAVPPTVSALSPSSFPLQHSLPPGTSPLRERCNPSRSRTRAPRRRKRIPKTLPSIFPAFVKKRSEHGRTTKSCETVYVLKKNIRNKSKRNAYHEQKASAKTKKNRIKKLSRSVVG